MPHFGQRPGPLDRTSGCIGHVYAIVAAPAALRCPACPGGRVSTGVVGLVGRPGRARGSRVSDGRGNGAGAALVLAGWLGVRVGWGISAAQPPSTQTNPHNRGDVVLVMVLPKQEGGNMPRGRGTLGSGRRMNRPGASGRTAQICRTCFCCNTEEEKPLGLAEPDRRMDSPRIGSGLQCGCATPTMGSAVTVRTPASVSGCAGGAAMAAPLQCAQACCCAGSSPGPRDGTSPLVQQLWSAPAPAVGATGKLTHRQSGRSTRTSRSRRENFRSQVESKPAVGRMLLANVTTQKATRGFWKGQPYSSPDPFATDVQGRRT